MATGVLIPDAGEVSSLRAIWLVSITAAVAIAATHAAPASHTGAATRFFAGVSSAPWPNCTTGRAAPVSATASVSAADMANSVSTASFSSADQASAGTAGASMVAAAGTATVAACCSTLRSANSSAPVAAAICGCTVVRSGARNASESRCVTSGMRAPPPTVTTAVGVTRARFSTSTIVTTRRSSGSAISASSSPRVTRTGPRAPATAVAVTCDSRSLAARLSARRSSSEATAEVPAGSSSRPSMTWRSSAWSTRSPENSS
ncbi:hypothetical protein MOBUDSM44075_04070 [Mycolicibacterium obuense]|uniref:Uncharacterized protein n=1 Tax=Mycolicibacterium obuense TaxID=1807 RepID=A0A0J6VS57_9MYCO|nr:hypothetical protein MOBUDSM44075_04070 [Mycolicibacterium obuense]